MNKKDELYHYGVKGMKWGKRKAIQDYLNKKRHSKRDAFRKAGQNYESSHRYNSANLTSAREIGNKNGWTAEDYNRWDRHFGERAVKYRVAANRKLERAAKAYDNSFEKRLDNAEQRVRNEVSKRKKQLRDFGGRVKSSVPSYKNSAEYEARSAESRRRSYDAKDAQAISAGERGNMDSWYNKRKSASKDWGAAYQHESRAQKKSGTRQDKAYQAIRGAKSKARSFINRLRKKKR